MSSYNYSYNVLINRLEAFAAGHFLIKRFTHGQIDLADQLQDEEYPFMHVVPERIAPVDGGMQFDFLIMFADIPRDKEYKAEYQREVISDCVRLGQDLIAEVKNGLQLFGFDVQLTNNPTFEPFMEEYKNTITGVTFTLSLEVPWDWSACDIPAVWSVGGSSTGGSGTGYGITLQTNGVNNALQNLLNLEAGANITITDNGNGTITIDSTGGGGGGSGTVTSVGLSVPSPANAALSASGSPITNSGTLAISANGTSSEYIDGTGALQTFPTIPAAQGLQDVIIVDSVMTQNNTVDCDTNGFTFDDTTNFVVNSTSKVNINVNSNVEVGLDSTGVSIASNVADSNQVIVDTNGISLSSDDGTNSTGIGLEPTQMLLRTPNVDAGTASNLQILSLVNATTGEVEFVTPASGGTVTSVALTTPAAFNVTGSPITTSGTLAITGAGTSAEYVDGTGALQTMPTGLPPTGSAGGDLTGTYPNPTVHRVHGIDMQSGTPSVGDVWLYEGSPAKWQHQQLPAIHVGNDSGVTGTTVKDALDHLNTTKVETTRSISTSSPLSGGGDLSANRTLSIADALADGATKGAAAFTAADFNSSSGVISIDYTNGQKATAAQPGFLTAADWSTFNSKVGTDSIAYASNPNISQAANSTAYWAITGGAAPNATENARVIVMPCAGTLKNLYIRIGALQASGGTMVFTLRKNAVDTAITVTFANADGSNVTKSDTTNTVTVAAGDTISIKGVNNAPSSASGTFVSFSILLERS